MFRDALKTFLRSKTGGYVASVIAFEAEEAAKDAAPLLREEAAILARHVRAAEKEIASLPKYRRTRV